MWISCGPHCRGLDNLIQEEVYQKSNMRVEYTRRAQQRMGLCHMTTLCATSWAKGIWTKSWSVGGDWEDE